MNNPIWRYCPTSTLTALALIIGICIGGCTRVMVSTRNDNQPDGGNNSDSTEGRKDIDVARDVMRQEASRKFDSAAVVDVTRNDWGNSDAGVGIRDVGFRDVGRRDIGIKDSGISPGQWVTIPAGTFMMGSPASETCRNANETRHQVTLTNSFEIQKTEVTQAQYQSLMGYNPSNFSSCGPTCPAENLNWYQAAAYCNALSVQAGYATCYNCGGSQSNVTCTQNASYANGNIYNCPGYRLPTEAEWEYAYRAGTPSSLFNNTNLVDCNSDANADAIGWSSPFSGIAVTHPACQKTANNYGLCDMAGNVVEWCNDWWDDYSGYGTASLTDPWGLPATGRHILRGGSYYYPSSYVRAAQRYSLTPTEIYSTLGFRCVRKK